MTVHRGMKLDKRGKIALTEAQIQRQCVEYLRAEGWIVRPAPREGYKAARGAHRVPAGEPDLIAVKRMSRSAYWMVRFIEVKSAKGKLSEEQKAWMDKRGEEMFVVRSLEDLKRTLAMRLSF